MADASLPNTTPVKSNTNDYQTDQRIYRLEEILRRLEKLSGQIEHNSKRIDLLIKQQMGLMSKVSPHHAKNDWYRGEEIDAVPEKNTLENTAKCTTGTLCQTIPL